MLISYFPHENAKVSIEYDVSVAVAITAAVSEGSRSSLLIFITIIILLANQSILRSLSPEAEPVPVLPALQPVPLSRGRQR